MEKIILIATPVDSYAIGKKELIRLLEEAGFKTECPNNICLPFSFVKEDVFALVAGAHIKCGREIMDYFPNLKIITPFGVGVDHIDLERARSRGIAVANAPAVSGRSVAELTIALILSLVRNVVGFDRSMKKGEWHRTYEDGLTGKKLGIVGLGNIGKEVAKMAVNLGMRVSAFDVFYDEKFLVSCPVAKQDFYTLLQTSDIVTLHCPASKETKHLLDEKSFSLMKDGAILINTARGDLIDSKALLLALNNGKVKRAALDVFSKEPPHGDSLLEELIKHPNVVVAPHIASFTPEAHRAVAGKIYQNIVAVHEGRLDKVDNMAG